MSAEAPVLVVALEADVGDPVVRAADLDEARLYLAGTAFRAVFVPDETAAAVLRPHSGSAPVHVVDGPAALAERLADPARQGEAMTRDEIVLALRGLQERIARVVHALNNPMAVVTGNAQLVLEVLRATGGDDLVVGAVEDIEAGARDLGERFDEILALRASLDELVGRL